MFIEKESMKKLFEISKFDKETNRNWGVKLAAITFFIVKEEKYIWKINGAKVFTFEIFESVKLIFVREIIYNVSKPNISSIVICWKIKQKQALTKANPFKKMN